MGALLMLTFVTGLVDAASYLGLGQVFVGFQTGNLVLLGFALAGVEGMSIAAPALSLCGFFAGGVLGGRLAARSGDDPQRLFALALGVEALLVGCAAVAALALQPEALSYRRLPVIAVLGLALGLRNATVRRLDVADLNTTVLTSTITGLAADSGRRGTGPRRPARLAAIAVMLLGAVAGALLVQVSIAGAFAVAAGLVTVIAGTQRSRRGGRPHKPQVPEAPPREPDPPPPAHPRG